MLTVALWGDRILSCAHHPEANDADQKWMKEGRMIVRRRKKLRKGN